MSSLFARQFELDRLFCLLLDAEENARLPLLERETSGDPRLRPEVIGLLEGATGDDPRLEPGAPLRGPIFQSIVRQVLDAADPRLGTRIGPWRLVRELGHGGMSVVYLAERDDGRFAQTVAIKLLPSWAAHVDAVRRFELERQILARLDQPNIARLLDGGETADGHPYLAMEYVEGEPITTYCARRNLNIADTVRLVVVVARAIAAAHRQLVVHRDIKPSNILVTSAGVVKVLDFGIAKLVGGAVELGNTATTTRALTLEYASPEMLRDESVSTFSDIYQLGLLLYELLAGRKAHDIGGQNLQRLTATICENDPPPPSASGRRGLAGDLDQIAACALAKDPAHRYASADHLADDLQRHLEQRPISVRNGARLYAASRWVARHRGLVGVAAATLTLVSVLIGTYVVTTTRREREIAAQAAKNARIEQFLSSLLLAGDPGFRGDHVLTVADLMGAGVRRVASIFPDDPDAQAELLTVITRSYITRGDYSSGIPVIERAIALRRLAGNNPLGLAESLRELGRQLHYVGRYQDAEAPFREALSIREAALAADDWRVAESMRNIGCLMHATGRYAEAEPLLRRGYRITLAAVGVSSLKAWQATIDLADFLIETGQPTEALALIDRALLAPAVLDEWAKLWLESSRAEALLALGRIDEARPIAERVLAERRAAHGVRHALTSESLRVLAAVEVARGELAAAETHLREVRSMIESICTARHAWVSRADLLLGEVLDAQGRHEEALKFYRAAIERLSASGMPDHPYAKAAQQRIGVPLMSWIPQR